MVGTTDESRVLSHFSLMKDSVSEYDVLCLPESDFDGRGKYDLFDAPDSIILSKHLKLEGLKCANSLDLNLQTSFLERRSDEKWYGTVFIRNFLVFPTVAGVLATLISSPIIEAAKKNENVPSKIHIELKVQNNDKVMSLKYDGDSETLIKVLNSLKDDYAKPKNDTAR